MFLADSRQVAIRRSLGQVFCAYFAKYFTHPELTNGLLKFYFMINILRVAENSPALRV